MMTPTTMDEAIGRIRVLEHALVRERRAYDRLQLCSDHRDKYNGQCVVCVAEERTRQEERERR